MQVFNRVELKLEKYEKCHVISDIDCPLGQLYDYSCALQNFLLQKMKDAQPQPAPVEEPKIEPIG